MGATHAPNTCPARDCGMKSPSRGDLQKHGRHDELVQRMVPEGRRWIRAWLSRSKRKRWWRR